MIVFFRVVDGEVRKGDKVRFLASRAEADVTEVGIMAPHQTPMKSLRTGEVGYLCGAIKDVLDARVGDTIVLEREYKAALVKEQELTKDGKEGEEPIEPLPGYSESVPMVFCGMFPVDADDYEKMRDALGKMRLNDAAITYEPETSGAMGFGFRCGFLGLLHMDVVRERLEREYDLDLIQTAPSVVYRVEKGEGEAKKVEIVDAPSKMPEIMRYAVLFLGGFTEFP